MGHRFLICCLCILSLILSISVVAAEHKAATGAAPQPGTILGVLEDIPAEYGEPDQRAVRAVFQKQGDEWVAFPAQAQGYQDLQALPASYPKQVTWTIAFDGHSLGKVTAETPPVFQSSSQVGVQEIISDDPVPVVGEKSMDFSGFRLTPVYRPLVALSQPNFEDPEAWKPADPLPALATAAHQLFRNRFPKALNCAGAGSKPKPWSYTDADIKLIKSFASNKQGSLIELSLTGWACDTIPEYNGPFHNQWYASSASGNFSFLGSDMNFVGAADYDNNGSSEFLFSIDGHNLAGYRLYYQNFTRSAEFIFYYQ